MIWKFIDRVCEDSLTAAVFSHLLHLPTEVFWTVLRGACYSTEHLPENVGELLSVSYWPSWSASSTGNSSRVIPDVLLRFTSVDLIIEAKRWDSWMQDKGQWRREFIAYNNVHGSEKIPVCMIALGGLLGTKLDKVCLSKEDLGSAPSMSDTSGGEVVYPVQMCRWERLLSECVTLQKRLKRIAAPSSNESANLRIVADVIELMEIHGFRPMVWMADHAHRLPCLGARAAEHSRTFQKIRQQLQKL